MICETSSVNKPFEVDVYNFYHEPETHEVFVTCWVVNLEYWITVPLHTISPINKKDTSKKQLLEENT